jgi:hypothetical protein
MLNFNFFNIEYNISNNIKQQINNSAYSIFLIYYNVSTNFISNGHISKVRRHHNAIICFKDVLKYHVVDACIYSAGFTSTTAQTLEGRSVAIKVSSGMFLRLTLFSASFQLEELNIRRVFIGHFTKSVTK